MIHLIPVDRARVRDALRRGSIASQLEGNPELHGEVLRPLATVIRSLRRASALHWALVQKLLIGPEKLSGSKPDSNQVMSYADVRQLADLRRQPALLSLIEKRLVNC